MLLIIPVQIPSFSSFFSFHRPSSSSFPGPRGEVRSSRLDLRDAARCVRGEISGNVGVEIGEGTEEGSSPETTRNTIRIAMRRAGCRRIESGEIETEGNGRSRPERSGRNGVERKEVAEEDGEGANDGLDFTLNCSSVRLMYRDARQRNGERRQRTETRN